MLRPLLYIGNVRLFGSLHLTESIISSFLFLLMKRILHNISIQLHFLAFSYGVVSLVALGNPDNSAEAYYCSRLMVDSGAPRSRRKGKRPYHQRKCQQYFRGIESWKPKRCPD